MKLVDEPLATYAVEQWLLGLGMVAIAFVLSIIITSSVASSNSGAADSSGATQIVQTLLTMNGIFIGFVIGLLPSDLKTRGDNLWKMTPNLVIVAVIPVITFDALVNGLNLFASITPTATYHLNYFYRLILDTFTLGLLFLFESGVGLVSKLLILRKLLHKYPDD